MSTHPAATSTSGRASLFVLVSMAIAVAIVAILVPTSASSSTFPPHDVLDAATALARPWRDHVAASTDDDGVTEEDGVLPDGVSVFDDGYPGVANLDPALLQALREAATDAAEDGVTFYVNSGWRSPDHQEQLLHDAVATYGSEDEAARWVATPETSAHVSGEAVDIGSSDASAWLSERGSGYGLCQTYANEPWHHELHPEAIADGCPRMYADPTEDPRLQPG